MVSFFQQLISFFTDTTNPTLRLMQSGLLTLGVVSAFLVFYTTRDSLLRSRSFLFQCFSILLVAALPIVGFFLYLLIRPARTRKERDMEAMLREILVSQKAKSVALPTMERPDVSQTSPHTDRVKGTPKFHTFAPKESPEGRKEEYQKDHTPKMEAEIAKEEAVAV